MPNGFSWSTAIKIAVREARSARAKFLFVILAVAAGVGSLTGVRGFSTSFRTMLLRDARTLMAADLSARLFALPNENQMAALRALEARGVQSTQVTETVTMVSSAAVPEPILISVKAVDPKLYPFYGTVKLNPPAPLQTALTAENIVVSNDLLLRLKVNVGDMVHAGGEEFRIVALVDTEPDRMSGTLNVGPRVMMSRHGLDRTGLIRFGSRASQRFLFRLPRRGPDVEETRQILKRTFPDALVIDFRETNPTITRGLNRATTFLSLVSLIALIVGALGVATAMHSHLQQKMDSIAIMKCLGARSRQIIRIYVAQTLGLGLAGGLTGVALGMAVQRVFPSLIARYFQMHIGVTWDWAAAVQGLVAGLLTTLLFTLPPLLSIRRVHPGLVLRREMAESKPGWRERLRDARPSLFAGGLILCGLGGIAAWLSGGGSRDSLRMGAYFIGGIIASLLALSAVAWALLRSLKALLRTPAAARLPANLRHGVANLYRPGNQAQSVLVALGLGVMFSLTIYLVQHSMLADIARSAPRGMPNVFLIGITEAQKEPVRQMLRSQPGVEGTPEIVPNVSVRLVSVNGTPVEYLRFHGWGRRFLQTRSASFSASIPEHTEILQGAWWKGDATGQVSVAEEAAKILSVQPGSHLQFSAFGRNMEVQVAAIHRTEAIRVGANNEFIFDPATLAGLPAIFYGGVRVQPGAVSALQRVAYQKFPTVSVINAADVLQIVQDVVDQIALVIRFISLFTILAGVIILASSVAGTRFRRIREVVILKTLGATRRRVGSIFSVEFLILGLVAGLMGSLLATGFSSLLLKRFFEGQFRFEPLPNLLAIVLTAVIANAAGWLASFRILGRKPLEVLREE
jgi:putative ABC transport system permease protein